MPPREKRPVNWRAWIIGILVGLGLIVALQNSQQVSVEVLFVSFDAPLIVMLLVFAALGALIGWAAPVLIRHRRAGRAPSAALDVKGIEQKK
ncbi:MAG TPA: LapA family protein [Solirubrobacterales bacterium]|nr:LapA family protein [Solirubrobacterales bacterium]